MTLRKRAKENLLFGIVLPIFLSASNYSSAQRLNGIDFVSSYVKTNSDKLGLTPNEAENLVLTKAYVDKSTGIHHFYATQTHNGLAITGTSFSVHTVRDKIVDANKLIPVASYKVNPVVVNTTSASAILAVMNEIGYVAEKKFDIKEPAKGTDQVTIYKRNPYPLWDIPTRLVYYNIERLKTLQPAWEVQMMDAYKRHFWLAYVDAASGKILEKTDLIKHCNFGGLETDAQLSAEHPEIPQAPASSINKAFQSAQRGIESIANNKYRVFDLPLENPIDSLQQAAAQTLSGRSGDTLASPDGWHKVNGGASTYNYTHGNNVWAFQDPSPDVPVGAFGVPSADPTRTAYPTNTTLGVPPIAEPFVFDYMFDQSKQPEDKGSGNQSNYYAAIVNLFYWNNLMHDVFYYMGFTEDAGNFQESHVFSTGTKGTAGLPNDEVLAQAQDGGGTNNANFFTPPDGANGQMQMYLWTTSAPDSLVQIRFSTNGIPPPGKKYFAVQGSFNSSPVAKNNLYTDSVANKPFVIVRKNPASTVGTSTQGCSTGQQSVALPPGNDVSGKIVLIDRGGCSFVEKVLGAQLGGAAGVIIINNVDGPPITMGGTDAPGNVITIPAVMISLKDGKELKAILQKGDAISGSLKAEKPPLPKRDGDVDNGIIAHEYGHGISTRLTGSLGGSEQGGEGWSDYVALYMTLRTNDLEAATPAHPNGVLPTRSIGNYVTYQPYNGRGIREYPYSTDLTKNPATFAYVKRSDYSETHSVGFVWCTMLYELMQTFIDDFGMNDNVYEGANPTNSIPASTAKGNNIATRLVIEAMKLQPTSPTFVQERDAILKADTLLYGGSHACKIWKAFAKRGLGFSAVSGSNSLGDEVEAFDVPFSCDPTQTRVRLEKTGPIKAMNNSVVTYKIKVTNLLPFAANNVVISDTLVSDLQYQSATAAKGTITRSGQIVKWTLNLAANDTATLTLNTILSSVSASTLVFADDQDSTTTNFAPANMGGLGTWKKQDSASQAYSGTRYWFAPDTDLGGANTTLTTTKAYPVVATTNLVFIHKFATESDYDGGVVELSEDNITWTYLPANKFIKGVYNGSISTINNPSIGAADLAAFTGASDGYMVSIAKLEDYAGKNIYIRFRFTSDAAGGSVANGGWWLDDVYILNNLKEISNNAVAVTNGSSPVTYREGSNANSTSSSFVLDNRAFANNLGNLAATATARSINVSWKTYSENNTLTFVVERKAPGEMEFRKIGEVNAAGVSNTTRDYIFTDNAVSSMKRYQYRIKQLNKSGDFAYTNIAAIQFGSLVFKASVYPNPVENVLNLSIVNPSAGKIAINVFDGLGKKLFTLNGGTDQSKLIAIPVTYLKPGTYWVEVNSDQDHTTLHFIKK